MIGMVNPFRLGTPDLSVADAEGRVIQGFTWVDVEDGRVDELSTRMAALAHQMGQVHDIVALAPLDTPVTDRQVVEVTTPERLAGVYKIDSVRTTRRHVRILCSRQTVKD